MFTRTIYTFTKLKQERERERERREERGERMQAIAEAPSSPDLAAGPAAVVVPASVPVATPSRSWRFCRHHR